MGTERRQSVGIPEGLEETFGGDACAHQFDWGDGFTDVYICENLQSVNLHVCRLLDAKLYFNKSVKMRS